MKVGFFTVHSVLLHSTHGHCTHGLHTHCKRSMCESGVKGPSHIQLMKSGCVQAIVQKCYDCKNKNAVHVQTFMWDKYIYFFKCPKKCPLPPFKLKILSHKSYLRWELIFKIKLRPWINVNKNLDWIITIKILHDKKKALKRLISVIRSAGTAFCDLLSWSASKILIGAPLVFASFYHYYTII